MSIADIRFSDESLKNTNANKCIKENNEATKFAKLAIEQGNVRNADNVDSKRTDQEFQEGDQVMLPTDSLVLKPGRVNKAIPKIHCTLNRG